LQAVLDFYLKGTLLCLLAWLATVLMRRSSAGLRNTIWTGTVLGLAGLPLLSLRLPVWNLPFLPGLLRRDLSFLAGPTPWNPSSQATPAITLTNPEVVVTQDSFLADTSGFGQQWSHWILVVLLAGALFYLGVHLFFRWKIWRLVRRSTPLSGGWSELTDTLRQRVGLRRRVGLLKTAAVRAGITVGVWRPQVILPAAAETWSDSRRRLVMTHELAHVKRWDALIEDLASVVTIIYWFNPLVWLALERLRIEREKDCDDIVLRSGARPSDYAEQLLGIAEDIAGPRTRFWHPARISQGSHLSNRLRNILDPTVNRRSVGRSATLLAPLLVLLLAAPLSSLGVWQPDELDDLLARTDLDEKSRLYWAESTHPERSAAYLIENLIEARGIGAAVATFGNIARDPRLAARFRVKESEMNALGYRLLYADRGKEALEIFKLNVATFPDSWNVYDSLGEGYLEVGKLKKAHQYYSQSLQIGSKNFEKATQIVQELETTLAAGRD
jgi:beta-lactamase regulating signal transducer with metallopeptidase domain